MVNLYDSNITDILPEIFKYDPKVQALGYAINKAMQCLMGYCQNIGIYNAIDTLPEDVLDLLAVEMKTQYYDDTMDIALKRALIKNTFVWYTKTGTPAAIQELVTAVFGNGEIQEWFEYGGEPYCFKINTTNINSTDEMIQTIEMLVSTIQNARSHLEAVIVDVMQQLPYYGGCAFEVISDSVTLGIDMDI